MDNIPDGFYPDPLDTNVLRKWAGGHWTPLTRTGPDTEPVERMSPHVGQSQPTPALTSATPPTREATVEAGTPSTGGSTVNGGALTVAILWMIVAVIVGVMFITGAENQEYGGDAYTGIQNTGAQTVRALGWLIIATGPLGLIVALSRRR